MSTQPIFSELPIQTIPNPWFETDPQANIQVMILTEENCLSIMQTVDTIMRTQIQGIEFDKLHDESYTSIDLNNLPVLSNLVYHSFKLYLEPTEDSKQHLETALFAARFFYQKNNLHAFADVTHALNITYAETAQQHLSENDSQELEGYIGLVTSRVDLIKYHLQLVHTQHQTDVVPYMPILRNAMIHSAVDIELCETDLQGSVEDSEKTNLTNQINKSKDELSQLRACTPNASFLCGTANENH